MVLVEGIAIGPALGRDAVDCKSFPAKLTAPQELTVSRRRTADLVGSMYLGQKIPLAVPPRAVIGLQMSEVALMLIEVASPQAWR